MDAIKTGFEATLEGILVRNIPDFQQLLRVDRLSGGASQETYRIAIETPMGEQLLAMRRAPVVSR